MIVTRTAGAQEPTASSLASRLAEASLENEPIDSQRGREWNVESQAKSTNESFSLSLSPRESSDAKFLDNEETSRQLDIANRQLNRLTERRMNLQEQQRRVASELAKTTKQIMVLNERRFLLCSKLGYIPPGSAPQNGSQENSKVTAGPDRKISFAKEDGQLPTLSIHDDHIGSHETNSVNGDMLSPRFPASPLSVNDMFKGKSRGFLIEDSTGTWGGSPTLKKEIGAKQDPWNYDSLKWKSFDNNYSGNSLSGPKPMRRPSGSQMDYMSRSNALVGQPNGSRLEYGIVSFKDTNDYGYILTVKDLEGPWVGYYSWKSLDDSTLSLHHGDIVSFIRVPNPRQSPPPFIATHVRLVRGDRRGLSSVPKDLVRLQELIKEGVPGKQLIHRFRQEAKRESGVLSLKGTIKDKGYIYIADREDARIGFRAHKSLLDQHITVNHGDLVSFVRQRSPRGYPPFIAVGVRQINGILLPLESFHR